MNWTTIIDYLAANWMEDAGVLTTLAGIWLTTRRKLICWPVVLISDVLYLIVFYRVHFYSDALLQIFFLAFTLYGWWYWWRGVRDEGEVRVAPLPVNSLLTGIGRGSDRRLCAWLFDEADSRHGSAFSGCVPDEL